MDDIRQKNISEHFFKVLSRNSMEISGVKEVISFDEENVTLSTVDGELCIDGENLKVSTLDTQNGCVSLNGKINSVYYIDDTKGSESHGFFSRLFK